MPRLAGKVAFITGAGNGRRAMSSPLSASLGICPGGVRRSRVAPGEPCEALGAL
jgi:hypothetical protein